MVKRVDVEYLLEMAKQCGDETQAELCRAWLALDAAPECEVFDVASFSPEGDIVKVDCKTETGLQVGTIVRLVATPASGGPRDGL